jgi:hypothetical protein
MSSRSDDRLNDGEGVATAGVTDADRALLLAMRGWGQECVRPRAAEHEGAHDFILRFGDWLDAGRLRRLCDAWDAEKKSADELVPARATDRLRQMHAASVEADIKAVHSTWLVRALQEESPAVQRLVAASVPESIRHSIQAGLLLDSQDIAPDRAVDPTYRDWVMGLWAERLLGSEPLRPDDSPALLAVCRLSSREGYRLCRVMGIGKLILAGENRDDGARGPLRSARAEWLRGRLTMGDPEFQALARTDVRSVGGSKRRRRHYAARIGLFTLARLLADLEPVRLRWALQHWPYPIAKLTRSLLSGAPKRGSAIFAAESDLFEAAWERLRLEGRLAHSWPETDGKDHESRST